MLAGELLAPGGRLAGEKTSTPADVIVAVAPYLQDLLGHGLTETQHRVAVGLMTGGHSLDVVVGVAGSGKTTP
jgi:hypothetical protein